MPDLDGLPAADRVARGLRDLAAGRATPEAAWIATAATRLGWSGISLPGRAVLPNEPELVLYAALAAVCDDPYGRYNAWRRELDSFLSALEARIARRTRGDQ